ncbi:MAG: hypothetical protein K5660_02980 [Paludibacteraceae bacterium]|nr:hypothetical protein [Paludibacteraceae bacterium]
MSLVKAYAGEGVEDAVTVDKESAVTEEFAGSGFKGMGVRFWGNQWSISVAFLLYFYCIVRLITR